MKIFRNSLANVELLLAAFFISLVSLAQEKSADLSKGRN
jgi:hypothetical protein